MNLFQTTDTHYIVHRYIDKDDWASARRDGIGGSDAASFMGCGFRSLRELWHDKKEGSSFKGNALTDYGTAAEPHLRELYKLRHPDQDVQYQPNTILQSAGIPWMRYSPDGLILQEDRKGIWECKTYLHRSRIQTEKDWGTDDNPTVPQKYYCQALHGLLVTGFEFVDFCVEIRSDSGCQTIERHLERADVLDDIKMLKQIEIEKYTKYFEGDMEPPMEISI